nr:uncharacterized protein LOC127303895 [Lolium perenne]
MGLQKWSRRLCRSGDRGHAIIRSCTPHPSVAHAASVTTNPSTIIPPSRHVITPPPRPIDTAPSSASSRSQPLSRSFAQVVAGIPPVSAMIGPQWPPVPPGTAVQAPGSSVMGPSRPVAASGASNAPYLGPPGFHGWPVGSLMPPAAPPMQPQPGFRSPTRMPVPQVQYVHMQPQYQHY